MDAFAIRYASKALTNTHRLTGLSGRQVHTCHLCSQSILTERKKQYSKVTETGRYCNGLDLVRASPSHPKRTRIKHTQKKKRRSGTYCRIGHFLDSSTLNNLDERIARLLLIEA